MWRRATAAVTAALLLAAPAAAEPVVPGLVEVDGHRLYMDCRGSGSPTVVVETELDSTFDNWRDVQAALAPGQRVCMYDRAGLGLSERGPEPRTSQRAVAELHALLQNAAVAGPYLMVGHGFGGLNVLLFAQTYPSEVSGLVLVDPLHEDWYSRIRMFLPAWARDIYVRQLQGNYEGMNLNASTAQVRTAAPRPTVPVIILAHTYGHVVLVGGAMGQSEQLWEELERDMADRLPSATLIVAEHSGHEIQHDEPQLVVDAVGRVRAAALERETRATAGAGLGGTSRLGLGLALVLALAGVWWRMGGPPAYEAEAEPRMLLRLQAGLRERALTEKSST
jgi:pimeloyl-ACP methyl ester carboxylesterase